MAEFTPLANAVLDDETLSPTTVLLYALLARQFDQEHTVDGSFTISQQAIGDGLGVSVRRLNGLMKELTNAGYVEVRRNGPKPATYRLHDGLREGGRARDLTTVTVDADILFNKRLSLTARFLLAAVDAYHQMNDDDGRIHTRATIAAAIGCRLDELDAAGRELVDAGIFPLAGR